MVIEIPSFSLVLMIGASGSGKSSFAEKHFHPFEVVSSDRCRGVVCNDPADQTVSDEAFQLVHFITRKRLALGKLTVIDATNIRKEDRKPLLDITKEYLCPAVAIILHLPEKLCRERDAARIERNVGREVIRLQNRFLLETLNGMENESFDRVFLFESEREVALSEIRRT